MLAQSLVPKAAYTSILAVLLLVTANLSSYAQHIYYTIPARQAGNIIGQKPESVGLYSYKETDSTIKHLAWQNEIAYGITVRDSLLFLSGLDGVLRSLDNGKSWKLVTDWRMPEAFQVYFDPAKPKTIYMICSTGIWKSNDLGDTWISINSGLKTTSQTYINTLLVLPGKLIAGTADGIFIKKTDSKKWKLAALQGKEIHNIKQDPYNSKHLIVATEDFGTYESIDEGTTWKIIGADFHDKTVYSIAFDPAHAGTVYCGGYKLGLCRYDSESHSWLQLSNQVSGKSIHSITINHSGKIYMGLINSGLFYSQDGGFTATATSETTGKIWQVQVAP